MGTLNEANDLKKVPLEHHQAKLERAFLEEFLSSKGHHLNNIHNLPTNVAKALMVEASIYASSKLAEIETRSNLINELHGNKK